MKSIFVLALATVLCVSFTSCNKEYTCRCKDHFGNQTDYPFTATSRKQAKDDCETYQATKGNCDLIYSR